MNKQQNVASAKKRSDRCCCVIDCKSSERNDPNLHFYVFPGRPWEKERRERWIISVRRNTIDGKPWQPSKNSRICSAHFLGGEKSNDPRKEAYNPTIFPPIYKKRRPRDTGREQRLEARRKKLESRSLLPCDKSRGKIEKFRLTIKTLAQLDGPATVQHQIGVQTDIDTSIDSTIHDASAILFGWQDNVTHEASTQISMSVKSQKKETLLVPTCQHRKTKNTLVGPDCKLPIISVGFANITDEVSMNELGGVSMSFFSVLLTFIEGTNNGQLPFFRKLSYENSLLLFLIKMKLGLSFDAIGQLFRVSKKIASSVFFAILEIILINTKTWLFWPSQEAIKMSMPPAFKDHPNTRAIIDCIEFRSNTPPTAEQRVLMYSGIKGCFTVKYMIAISPCGLITFLSKGHGGRITDDFLINESGVLNLIQSDDEIFAVKSFSKIRLEFVESQFPSIGPSVACDTRVLRSKYPEDCSLTPVRIHFDRVMQRVKKFRILDRISIELLPYIDEIMHLACLLVNNQEPIVFNT